MPKAKRPRTAAAEHGTAAGVATGAAAAAAAASDDADADAADMKRADGNDAGGGDGGGSHCGGRSGAVSRGGAGQSQSWLQYPLLLTALLGGVFPREISMLTAEYLRGTYVCDVCDVCPATAPPGTAPPNRSPACA